jgi:hypothetical protein
VGAGEVVLEGVVAGVEADMADVMAGTTTVAGITTTAAATTTTAAGTMMMTMTAAGAVSLVTTLCNLPHRQSLHAVLHATPNQLFPALSGPTSPVIHSIAVAC